MKSALWSSMLVMAQEMLLGPWTVSADWRFSGVNAHKTPTSGLQVGSNLPLVFGADTAIYLATSPEVSLVSGEYFYRRKIAKTSVLALDDADAARLWETSAALTAAPEA